MHKVKRAIIMAAGMGNRMRPITLEIPKPLVKINGVRMIDTVIKGLQSNGINEIYIVVGYMKEKFQILEEEYSGVKLIENPYYASCNNISSLYAAREYLSDVIIMDGDQMIYNNHILEAEFDRSGYNCVWTNEKTDEWVLNVEKGTVISCSRSGADSGWQLYSISRWSEEDCAKLRKHLKIEFVDKKNRQIYWDDVALFCYPEEYHLGVRKMEKEDVIEVDNLSELAALDSSYSIYGGKAKWIKRS